MSSSSIKSVFNRFWRHFIIKLNEHNASDTAHNDIREAVENLPINVTDDGYTEISGLRHITDISSELSGNTLTITQTFEGGTEVVDTIQLNDKGLPVSGIFDGVSCSMELLGFSTSSTALIPPCTEEDNGKVLCVVDGVPTWTAIPNAEEATF
jgi:hypothetical protein